MGSRKAASAAAVVAVHNATHYSSRDGVSRGYAPLLLLLLLHKHKCTSFFRFLRDFVHLRITAQGHTE